MTSFGTVKCVIDQVEAELQVVEDIDGSTKLLLGLPFQKRAGYIIDTVNMRVLQGNEFWENNLDGDPSEDNGDLGISFDAGGFKDRVLNDKHKRIISEYFPVANSLSNLQSPSKLPPITLQFAKNLPEQIIPKQPRQSRQYRS
jgi:hypothetical protein